MPAYTYHCKKCDVDFDDLFVKYDDRDKLHKHDECGNRRCARVQHTCATGSEPYQMKAVLGSGEHVKGHFGKSAKRNKS